MKPYFFAWCAQESPIDDKIQYQEDLKIFEANLIEEEGRYGLLKLSVQNPKHNPHVVLGSYGRFGLVKKDAPGYELLFEGRYLGIISDLGGEIVTLEFQGTCIKREAEVSHLKDQLKQSGDFAYIYVPPTNTAVVCKAVLENDAVEEVKNHFYNSLKVISKGSPIEKLTLKVKGKWLRRYGGVVDLSTQLQQQLPEGKLTTYLGKTLEQSWGRAKNKQLLRGVEVIDGHLEEIPVGKKELSIEGSRRPLKLRVYKPFLKVRYEREEEVHENFYLSFESGSKELSLNNGSKKRQMVVDLGWLTPKKKLPYWAPDILYRLGDQIIFDAYTWQAARTHRSQDHFEEDLESWTKVAPLSPSSLMSQQGIASYFETENGLKDLQKACQQALLRMYYSARCFQVEFSLGLKDALMLFLGESINLIDHRFCKGVARGRIVYKRTTICGATGLATTMIRLATFCGDADHPEHSTLTQEVVEKALQTPGYLTSKSGMEETISEQEKHSDLRKGQSQMSASDLLREVRLVNDATTQELKAMKDCGTLDAFKALQTNLQLEFENCQRKGRVQQSFTLETPLKVGYPSGLKFDHT